MSLAHDSNQYDPSLEWPGGEEDTSNGELDTEGQMGTTATAFFRLIAIESTVLSPKHRLAILTGFPEIQFGRDKPVSDTFVPRIRLREMAVSKIHATAYWDGAKREWALVDMGSMHGTFWKSGSEQPPGSSSSAISPIRLSPPRVASMPQSLRHLDRVTIGGTTFEVHTHEDDLACSLCASTGNEIPLFHSGQKTTPKSTESRMAPRQGRTDPKKSLAMLKSSLLSQHSHSRESAPSSSKYTDRADRRRQMYGSLPPSVGPAPRAQWTQYAEPPPPRPPVNLVSAPPTRIAASNVGHGLLTKMGWEPGTTLGLSSAGSPNHLLEPIQPKHTTNRAGLGVKATPIDESRSWQEAERLRRCEATEDVIRTS